MKPVLHVRVQEYANDYIQNKRLKQIFSKAYGHIYEVIFTPSLVDIKADNMISLTVNKDTDYDKLIETIENHMRNNKGG